MPYAGLLEEFIETTRLSPKINLKKSDFAHRILTNGLPITERCKRLAGEKVTAARAEINYLLETVTCRPCSSS